METVFDARPAVRFTDGYIVWSSRQTKTALIEPYGTKEYTIPETLIPSGYTCVGYYGARYTFNSDGAFDAVVFEQGTQLTPSAIAITKIVARNTSNATIYSSYVTSGSYQERIFANLVCVRNDLLTSV